MGPITQKLTAALATFFVASSISLTAQAGLQGQSLVDNLENFFSNLGFRDYSADITKTLEADRTQNKLTVIQKLTLQMNEDRYQSYNTSRELAIKILTKLYENPTPDQIAKTIRLTATQMGMKPAPPPHDWPREILAMPEKTKDQKDAKDKARLDFVEKEILKDINIHTQKVVSDVVETIYGQQTVDALNTRVAESKTKGSQLSVEDQALMKDLQNISTEAENLVAFYYLDGEMGDNILGQALALGVTKFEIDRNKENHTEKNHDVTAELAKEAMVFGERLSDYTTSTLIFEDRKHGQVPIEFRSGMVIAERAAIYPQESSELTWAAVPGSLGNYIQAKRLGLVGRPEGMIFGFEDGGDHQQTLWQKIKYWISERPRYNNGLSHAGWAYVFKDPETGIVSVKAADIYPGLGQGGIRIIRLKKFASRGINLRFATNRIDATKFRAWAREQLDRGLVSTTAWDGKKEFVDENGEPIPNAPSVRDDWPTSISLEEIKRRYNAYTDDQAEAWFENEIIEPALARVIKFLTTDGVAFAENFSNYKWRSYCSKLVSLTIKMETGFDIQTYPDRYNLLVQAVSKLGYARGSDLNQRIVAPGGLFWQVRGRWFEFWKWAKEKGLSAYMQIINNPDDGNFEDRMKTQFAPMPKELNDKTTVALENLAVITTDQKIPYKYVSDSDSGLVYRIKRAMDGIHDKARKTTQRFSWNSLGSRSGVSVGEGYMGSCPILLDQINDPNAPAGKNSP